VVERHAAESDSDFARAGLAQGPIAELQGGGTIEADEFQSAHAAL